MAAQITEAESEVLAALWRRGPLTATRLVEEVKTRRPWADATIKTLLQRLMQKKLVRSERDDGRLQYRPLIAREAWVADEVTGLIERVFDGRREALAAYLTKV